jgi:hypothetical protein
MELYLRSPENSYMFAGSMPAITPHEFVGKWRRAEARERQSVQEHFIFPVPNVASPCSSCIAWLPCCVVRHDPFACPLAPDLFDSTFPAAGLFVFLRLISQLDHDFFPLQKASLCMYNSSIDWWRE